MVKNRLREIRMREYMMSQKEFALMLDMLPHDYNRIENMKKQVTVETALKIAKKLNKKVEDIFELQE
ncbi:helix-turn-helix domain-containing protein [Caloramator sp. CAR-1]|uniref:helix-turn-helix transcriptional regulator n=1 Tax=Caloramator sp. CAR-1 TaxID=3062777 RepID=UPI0026E3D423|nr:helix-turn-helix domain-containing protein [Caloramator sp. CAR-1]MDO6355257.1 helix-turn-helix domain-containing protein [Caloramator sp. CAR-1]